MSQECRHRDVMIRLEKASMLYPKSIVWAGRKAQRGGEVGQSLIYAVVSQ